MSEINIHEAKTQFSKLLKRVAAGEEIVIARSGEPIDRLLIAQSLIEKATLVTADAQIIQYDVDLLET